MKSTTLKTLLFGMFLVAAVGLKAQDASGAKYDYAEVKFLQSSKIIAVSQTGGATLEKINVPKEESKAVYDFTFVVNYIQKMTDTGWAVYSVTEGSIAGEPITSYHLRRKK